MNLRYLWKTKHFVIELKRKVFDNSVVVQGLLKEMYAITGERV
ncbi:MAG: hypothetical protein WAO75_04890 [Atribacterales bacterium]